MENRIEKNEKKVYETPVAEKIEFQYEEQIAASAECKEQYVNTGNDGTCEDSELFKPLN